MNRAIVDGAALEFVQLPAPDGAMQRAPIVFLHEGLGSVAMWRDWPARLCRESGRAGLVYSRRGYGQSQAIAGVCAGTSFRDGVRGGRLRPDYLHHEAWTVLPAMLAQFRMARPVLVGHSDGASIALLHASRFPITACVAMAPHVTVEELSLQAIEQARSAFGRGDLRQRLARYHADVDRAFWQWNDIWLDPAFRDFDIRQNCQCINAPVLAIQGVDDPYGSQAQIDQIAPAHGPVQRVVLVNCGHSPQRDQEDETTRRIVEFLGPLD